MTAELELPGLHRKEVVRLALADLRHSRLRSAVTATVVVLSVAVVVATSGRTWATRTVVIGQLEAPAARIVRVTDQSGSGHLLPGSVDRLADVSAVEWSVALDAAGSIAHNAQSGSAHTGYLHSAVGLRRYRGDLLGASLASLVVGHVPADGEALVGVAAARDLGMPRGRGLLVDESGRLIDVVGEVRFAAPIADLNDYAFVRGFGPPGEADGEVGEIRLLARTSADVPAFIRLLPDILGPADPRALAIEGSGDLARLQAGLGEEVGSLDTAVLLGSLVFGVVVVSVNLFGSVAARRREIGLRRTQGAERSSIAAMLIVETTVIATFSAVAGALMGSVIVYAQVSSVPRVTLSVSAAALVVIGAILASLPPAVAAARQDPLYALRA